MLEFPKSLPVKSLEIVNASYNEPWGHLKIRKHDLFEALYHGGSTFERIKKEVLWKREIDDGEKAGAIACKKARLQAATYTNHIASYEDSFAAKLFKTTPVAVFAGPEDKLAYYRSLNKDIGEQLYKCQISLMNHGRAYLGEAYPDSDEDYADQYAQLYAGALDAKIAAVDFDDITDWVYDEDGDLEWVKIRKCDLGRPNAWSAPDTENYVWTFICADAIYEYEASKPILDKTGAKAQWPKDAKAKQTKSVKTDGSAMTIIELPTKYCFMDSAAPLGLALFNREASLDFALNASAWALLVVKSEKRFTDIMASEMAAMQVNPGDDVGWTSPDNIVYEALDKNVELKRRALEDCTHSTPLNMAQRDVQGRASGDAKAQDKEPTEIALEIYADALRKGLCDRLDAVIRNRGDEGVVTYTILGLDNFDLSSLDDKMRLATEFCQLPGVSPTAKKYLLSNLSQAMIADAPAEIRESVRDEADNMSDEDVSPKPPEKPMEPVGQEGIGRLPIEDKSRSKPGGK